MSQNLGERIERMLQIFDVAFQIDKNCFHHVAGAELGQGVEQVFPCRLDIAHRLAERRRFYGSKPAATAGGTSPMR